MRGPSPQESTLAGNPLVSRNSKPERVLRVLAVWIVPSSRDSVAAVLISRVGRGVPDAPCTFLRLARRERSGDSPQAKAPPYLIVLSIQVTLGEGFFVESEVVSEFVQVGAADFFLERRAGFFALLQNVFEI